MEVNLKGHWKIIPNNINCGPIPYPFDFPLLSGRFGELIRYQTRLQLASAKMLSVKAVILPFACFLLHLALVCSQGPKDWGLDVDYKDNGRNRHLSVDANKQFGKFGLGGSYKTDFSRYKGSLSGSYNDRDSGFGAGFGVGTDGSNWKGSLGATKSWEIGGGQLKASGRVDTSGGWSVGLSGGWRFKRRRRSLGTLK